MDLKIPGTPIRKAYDDETSLLANIDDILLLRKEFNYFPEYETTPQKIIRPLKTPKKQQNKSIFLLLRFLFVYKNF